MNVVLSSYLIKKPDPQRNVFWKPNDSDVVKTWIGSVEKFGLNAVIFHDELSSEFCEDWAGAVRFKQVMWSAPWSATEERFQIYMDWIIQNECDLVLTTDISDVEFYLDPFPLMDDPDKIYIGVETWKASTNNCVGRWMKAAFGEVTDTDKMILNPGILGGHRETLIGFLGRLIDEMRLGRPGSVGLDLVAFNRLIYRDHVPFVAGPPLHTKFMSYESPPCGAAIRHK